LAFQEVFTKTVLEYVEHSDGQRTPVLDGFFEDNLKNAGTVAQYQVYIASKRLANVWARCMETEWQFVSVRLPKPENPFRGSRIHGRELIDRP
jgi:hypothetical protein